MINELKVRSLCSLFKAVNPADCMLNVIEEHVYFSLTRPGVEDWVWRRYRAGWWCADPGDTFRVSTEDFHRDQSHICIQPKLGWRQDLYDQRSVSFDAGTGEIGLQVWPLVTSNKPPPLAWRIKTWLIMKQYGVDINHFITGVSSVMPVRGRWRGTENNV